MGFTTKRSSVIGFVTASHCTNEWYAADVSTKYIAQPTATSANDIGHEAHDLALFDNAADSNCPVGKNCRYSDAAFIDTDSGVTVDNGYIARTLQLGDKTVSTSNPQWRVTVEDGSPAVNDTLERNGSTTGWRRGDVVNTCASVDITGSNDRFLCSYSVDDITSSGGDSGGPVFEITNSPSNGDVSLMGILFAGSSSKYWFSNIGNIYSELGSSSTWDSCYSGC